MAVILILRRQLFRRNSAVPLAILVNYLAMDSGARECLVRYKSNMLKYKD